MLPFFSSQLWQSPSLFDANAMPDTETRMMPTSPTTMAPTFPAETGELTWKAKDHWGLSVKSSLSSHFYKFSVLLRTRSTGHFQVLNTATFILSLTLKQRLGATWTWPSGIVFPAKKRLCTYQWPSRGSNPGEIWGHGAGFVNFVR